MVATVDGDGVGVGLEEGVEVGEGGLAVAALEEAALAARGKDLWAEELSTFKSLSNDGNKTAYNWFPVATFSYGFLFLQVAACLGCVDLNLVFALY